MIFPSEIFSRRFAELRKNKRETLLQVGMALGTTKQSVQRWEAGKIVPSSEMLIALALHFDVSLDYLTGLSDDPVRH